MPNLITGNSCASWLMEPGELREPIASFITHLTTLGYSKLTARGYEDSARHFGEWLARSGIIVSDIDDRILERLAQHLRLAHDLTLLIDYANTALFQRNVDPGIVRHRLSSS